MGDDPTETGTFTRNLTVHGAFEAALAADGWRDVPENWLIALTDVVESRKAIARGAYKPVNMAGVAGISAVMNALENQDIPYIFGGDGAVLVCAPGEAPAVEDALARTSAWVRDELGLELRAAMIPVSEVLRQGVGLRVAALRVSDAVNNYAFAGGGISRAERMMKSGEHRVEPAAAGSRPDLSGLSCRWTPIAPDGRIVASIIVEPQAGHEDVAAAIARRIGELVGDGGRPVPDEGPGFTWPPQGLELEARAARGDRPLSAAKRSLYLITLLAWILDKTGIALGGFDPKRYRRYTALNTDYRKIHDGLRMTVSLPPDRLGELRAYLEGLRGDGRIRFGICEQDQAVLTCYVPSITSDAHFHFLDGAGGGYAEAASRIH